MNQPNQPTLQTLAQAFTNVGTVSGYRQALQGAAANLCKAGDQHVADTKQAAQKLRGVRGYLKGKRAVAEAERFREWVRKQAVALEVEANRREPEERQHQKSAQSLLGALVQGQAELESKALPPEPTPERKPLWQRALDKVTSIG